MASSSLLTLLCLVAASLAQDCYWPAGASHSARCYKDHYCLCFEHGQDVQVAIVRELLLRNLSISDPNDGTAAVPQLAIGNIRNMCKMPP
ncbi:hypothetical protein E4U30_005494 [Claviceps sp. LM220 group G6]|nr:hypothetical protein E4U15_001146 [Claviceps sp. LM218 group G6]KAG6092381.1 hypothetical protein E4U30_005494 [Claviceps sp. LM220 group G6]KAG6103352.1 hypothetical protein E4U31_002893 [Claviceps sp. LM219 group G6]